PWAHARRRAPGPAADRAGTGPPAEGAPLARAGGAYRSRAQGSHASRKARNSAPARTRRSAMRQESDLERTHRNLPPPWDRIFSLGTRVMVWGLLFGVLYILRPFFLLIFLTFVFAYIQAHGVDGLQHRIRNRPARVVLVALVFLSFIGAVGYFIAPQLAEQVQDFAGNYQKHAAALNRTVHELGDKLHLPKKQAE